MQKFLGLVYDQQFFKLAESLQGYDVQLSGRMLLPKNSLNKETKPIIKDERIE